MSDEKKLSHEDLERWIDQQPLDALNKLPNNTESREAKRLQIIVGELAHDSVERPADRA
jgi:hypothetical protein